MFCKLRIDHLKVLIFNCALYFFLSADAPDTLWTRTYGGNEDDVGYSVLQTSDGGFIVAGYTKPYGADWEDVYLIRTNAHGDTLWTRTYGGAGGDKGYSVRQTNDSGYIIVGSSCSFGADDEDVYLIRSNSNGDTLWTKTYGDTLSNNLGYSIQQTDDGGFIIAGATWPSPALSDVYVIRTDANGDTVWTKTYGGLTSLSQDDGRSVLQVSDGGFIIAGSTIDEDSTGTYNFWYVYLIRTDLNGDTVWTKTHGGDFIAIGSSIHQTIDDGFIITGRADTSDVHDANVYLIYANSYGDTIWTKTYGGTGYDEGKSVLYTSNNGYIIVGRTMSFGAGDFDVYIIRINMNGDTLWTKTIGGTEEDIGASIQQTSDNGYIIAGHTKSFGAGGNDVYLIRIEPEVGIQDLPENVSKQNNFTVFYNHANNLVSIRYTIPYSSPVKLEAYDITGKLVKVITDSYLQKGFYTVNWNSKRFGAGVYYIKLSAGNTTLIRKAIIIK